MKRWSNTASMLALSVLVAAPVWMGACCAVSRGPSAEELAAMEAERQRAVEDSLRAVRAEEEARLAAEEEARRLAEEEARLAAEEEARRLAEEEARLAAEAAALHAEMMSLSTIYFNYDRSNVREDQRPALDENAQKLREYQPEDMVVVEGHADERGTIEYNLALGERRAQAVKTYLVDAGVADSRIETVSFGAEKPAVMGSDESAWSQNRRVELMRK
ncbi:MAG: peptidoglycan-associated lipoprotein Pal [Gemmatimonadetes bacterium]|nr:peptidoglycan-associated lipoprotein Pal [Gemmatimonadota bacterium]